MTDSWNDSWNTYLAPLGRLLLSSLFIWAGYTKLFVFGPGGTAHYMESVHIALPGLVAWVAIIVELVGGILILVGFQTRWVALALAFWCLLTGFAVHLPVRDLPNMTDFYKNLVMAGGLLFVACYGPGAISVDQATGIEEA
jgi:putative oxidoreductase